MKLRLHKLEFTCIDPETGKFYMRSLEGKDVTLWDKFMIQVCMFAREHGQNPWWGTLNWTQKELKVRGKNAKLFEEILNKVD